MILQTSDYLEDVSFLLCDSNGYMRRVVKNVLEIFGAKMIDEVRSGPEALEVLKQNMNDILVTEWMMEGFTGMDLLAAVRSQRNELRFTPVIMCTSMTTHANIVKCRNAGVTEIVAKPISANALFLRVREIIQRPRPFVDVGGYFGPDRRRRSEGPQDGQDRRGQKRPKEKAVSQDKDRSLTQEEIDRLVAGDSISSD